MLLSTVPTPTPPPTFTVSVNAELAPLASKTFVALTQPLVPTTGVVTDHPTGAVNETKVAPAGSASVRITEAAAEGPLLVTVIEKARSLPAATVALATLVTARSASGGGDPGNGESNTGTGAQNSS